MNKGTLRNVLLVFGTWSLTSLLAWILSFLPLRGISFEGDLGAALLWIWLGVPHLLAAIAAAYTLIWITETRNPLSWLLGLAALIFYSEGIHVWKQLGRPWHGTRIVADYVGIAIAAVLPAFACLVIGVWRTSRLASKVHPAN